MEPNRGDIVTVLDTDALIAEYMPLAQSLALQVWRTAPHALELDELRAIGYLGLVGAATRWESYCVAPETLVLTAGLRWVRADSLEVEDEIVGVDEYPAVGRDRKYRRAAVTVAGRAVKPCARITFTDGRTVFCSLDHPWLTVRQVSAHKARIIGVGGTYSWVETARLRPGDRLCAPLRVWPEEDTAEVGWLAGILDGEGCLNADPRRVISSGEFGANTVNISQNDGVVLDRIKQTLTGIDLPFQIAGPDSQSRVWRINVNRRSAAMELLGRTKPVRLNAARLWEGASIYTRHGRDSHTRTIEAVELIGPEEVVVLETSSGTYLANGLVAHNCRENEFSPYALEYFKTFVQRRIHGALYDAIRASDWATRGLRSRAKALQAAGQERGATDAELAERTGLSIADVRSTIRGMARRPVSLEAEELDPQGHTDVESTVFTAAVLDRMVGVIRDLPGDQQAVIALHYHRGLQLQAIAAEMGIAESRASQLHARAVLTVHEALQAAVADRGSR
jgi:RNA polymerase sigma factor for flagellar operon FliA